MSPNDISISVVAHLIGEPARSIILITLLEGGAYSASSLAETAGVTAQTASSHLSKLLAGGLLTVEKKGRHRYYRLAGPHVSRVLEGLACVGPVTPAWRNPPNRSARELRFARACYDHLAGQLGVAITQSMLAHGLLIERGGEYSVTLTGVDRLHRAGIDLADLDLKTPGFGRQCLDWTERQYHVAGPFGAHMMEAFRTRGWIRRVEGARTVAVTPPGWEALEEHFGIEPEFDRQQRTGLRLRSA